MAAADPQIIANIYRRLQNGFAPAVRSVAQTGTNLLTLQSGYYKAFDAHLLALQDLAKSGGDVSEESNRYTSEIAGIISAFQQINREEEKLFISFANLMAAVSKFSESEKDRIKELNHKFSKDEKTIEKSSKRTGNNSQIQEFYGAELKKAKEQHAQRYAYFAKNYLELLRKQSSISKKNAEISEKQLLESEAADAVKSLDEVVTSNDTVKSHSTDAIIVHEETNQVYEQPLPVETNQVVVVQRNSVKSQKAEDKSRRSTADPSKIVNQSSEEAESRPHTAASRLSSASGLGGQSEADNRSLNTNSYGQRGHSPMAAPRKVLSPNIYKATPILGLMQAEFESQRQQQEESENEVTKIPRATANGNSWTKQNYEKERDYFDSIPRPDYVPEEKIYDPNKQQPQVVKKPYTTQPYEAKPEIAPRNENKPPPPRYVKPETNHPAFSVADYGRSLACTQSYTGQGDHQLSLNRGDQVKLVKSGTRGWALVRSSDSRQGWFPVKYLAAAL